MFIYYKKSVHFILGGRPSSEPGHIGGLFLWYGTEVVKKVTTTICDSCWLPHDGVAQTKDTWCNVRLRSHILDYIICVAKACNFHMWGLHHICRSASRDVAYTIMACIVGTRLDYCYALLHGATENSLN